MTDWRFASISGFLTWTTPSLPDGGTELFSELSPTLIIGLQEQGDVLPVDYIKLQTIASATLSGNGRAIELTRDGSPTVLLVANTAHDAQEWLHMIQVAMGEGTAQQPKSAKPKAPAAAAPSQFAADAPRLAAEVVSAPADSIPRGRTGSTTSQQSANMNQSRGFGSSTTEPTTPPLSLRASAAPVTANPFAQAASSNNGSQQSSDTGSLKLNLSHNQQQRWAGAAQPSSSVPRASSTQQAANTASSSSCIQDPSGAHDFRPLSEVTGIPSVKTTTVTTHLDLQRPLNARYGVEEPRPAAARSTAWTPLTKTMPSGDTVSPSPNIGMHLGMGSRPLPNGMIGPTAGTAVTGGSGAASSSVMQPQQSVSPIAPEYQHASMHHSQPSGASQRAAQSTGNTTSGGNQYFASAAFDLNNSSVRKRSGMLVDVPPNPQVNRNVAPNVSAIWKEWSGPDGVLYVCHEPTGTLQRRNPETGEFETLVDGAEEINAQDMALRPYSGNETAVDLNSNVVKNLARYGGQSLPQGVSSQQQNVSSPSVYRTTQVTSPRGQYSPSRRSNLSALSAPRQSQSGYNGRRVHHLTLGLEGEEAAIEHQIQVLGGSGLRWDPQSGQVVAPQANQGEVGASTLQRQWEHVRKILMQGRYFKKHALRTATASFRFVFLTSDNAYVVCVPTSEVHFNVSNDPKTFGTVAETIQYYGPDSRAIALNTITHVSLGSDEQFVRNRSNALAPENTFCIVSRTHAFILECNTAEEAKYFADAWTFFLYHSKPVNTQKQRTAQMRNPVTFGTRTGIAF